jgi:hypothetical protein
LITVPGEGHFFFLRNFKDRMFGNSIFHFYGLERLDESQHMIPSQFACEIRLTVFHHLDDLA